MHILNITLQGSVDRDMVTLRTGGELLSPRDYENKNLFENRFDFDFQHNREDIVVTEARL